MISVVGTERKMQLASSRVPSFVSGPSFGVILRTLSYRRVSSAASNSPRSVG